MNYNAKSNIRQKNLKGEVHLKRKITTVWEISFYEHMGYKYSV